MGVQVCLCPLNSKSQTQRRLALFRFKPLLGIGRSATCFVVLHFLKMRYGPGLVRRTTMESADELIVHPAARHLVECLGNQSGIYPAPVLAKNPIRWTNSELRQLRLSAHA